MLTQLTYYASSLTHYYTILSTSLLYKEDSPKHPTDLRSVLVILPQNTTQFIIHHFPLNS
jgi:hypothetical protein